MNQDQAVKALNEMAFKPGWRVRGERASGGAVFIVMYIDTVNTSYPDHDGQCRQQFTIYRERRVYPENLDLEGLCYQVLALAAQTDIHEDREFLKVRQPDGSWESPLHPHTDQGEHAWLSNLQEDRDVSRIFV